MRRAIFRPAKISFITVPKRRATAHGGAPGLVRRWGRGKEMWAGALIAVSMGMDTWAQDWLISVTAVGLEAEGLPPDVWVALVGVAVGG